MKSFCKFEITLMTMHSFVRTAVGSDSDAAEGVISYTIIGKDRIGQ